MALVSVVVTDEICLSLSVAGVDGVFDLRSYARARQTLVSICIISRCCQFLSNSEHRVCTNHDPLLGFWKDT